MQRLPPLRYHSVTRAEEAVQILAAEGPRARLLAGGTDLIPNLKRRHQQAETLVGLRGARAQLAGLSGENGGQDLTVGGMTSLLDLERNSRLRGRYPALAEAIQSIASPPIRAMGTLGGNLLIDTRCTYYNQSEEWRKSIGYCMKEKGEICWVATSSPTCWAHTASDSAPILSALGARIRILGTEGERQISLDDLYRNDGMDYHGLQPGEVLTSIEVPLESDAEHCRSAFWKLRRRGSIDFAVLSVAAALWLSDQGEVIKARIYLGAVASAPKRALKVEEHLVGSQITEDLVHQAAALAPGSATPMDNTDFHTAWRRKMAAQYTEAALREAAGLPGLGIPKRHGFPD